MLRCGYKLTRARAILDGRLSFKLLNGYDVIMVFAVQERLSKFAKMILPDTPELRAQVGDMTTPKIGFNYEYRG